MSQPILGGGLLLATPQQGTDLTPILFGTLQEVSTDISYENKSLYGSNDFPDYVARTKGKIDIKAKFGIISGKLYNNLFFNGTQTVGQTKFALNEPGATAIPATPFQLTVTNAATFVSDQGVSYSATGTALTKVPSAPTAGQYSVAAGVYTFAAADTGALVLFRYTWKDTVNGVTYSRSAQLMGTTPYVSLWVSRNFNGVQSNRLYYRAMCSKLTEPAKNDDFMVPEMDFMAMYDSAGRLFDEYDASF